MTTTTVMTDGEIKRCVVDELRWLPYLDDTKIGVAVKDGAVMLSGEVDSYPEKLQAEHAVRRVRGVAALAEELTVSGKWQGPGDLDIARDATQALERAVNVPEGVVAATVHDHVITLSGELSWQFQREAAARAVRYVKGVTGVRNVIVLRSVASAVGIRTAIVAALARSAELDGRSVTVHASDEGLVRLEGAVRTRHEREAAERAAWLARGVTAVVNDLDVRP